MMCNMNFKEFLNKLMFISIILTLTVNCNAKNYSDTSGGELSKQYKSVLKRQSGVEE